jgi:hypothetical protein
LLVLSRQFANVEALDLRRGRFSVVHSSRFDPGKRS